jgi:peroxiredoxin
MEHLVLPAHRPSEEVPVLVDRAGRHHQRIVDILNISLGATAIGGRGRRESDAAPDVVLPDALGRPARLSDFWKEGPLVVVFYRGGWCPYCNFELQKWQGRLGDLRRHGARLVAISPQTPEHSVSTTKRNGLAFPVLSDSELDAANGFDIALTLPPELVDIYGASGTNLPVQNGNGQWVLPVPATFVVDEGGIIRFAHIDMDYRQRAEPDEVLNVVEHLRATDNLMMIH